MNPAHRVPRVILARSAEGNRELSAKLRGRRILPVAIDTVEFADPPNWKRVDDALLALDRFDWIVLTSVTGAEAFMKRARKLRIGGAGIPRIAVVGRKTAAYLRKKKQAVAFIPSEYVAAALGRELPREFGARVLLLRADRANIDLDHILKKRGFRATSIPIYATALVDEPLEGVDVRGAVAVIFGSPSEVEGLSGRLPSDDLEGLKASAVAACVGPVTAKCARRAGFARVVTPQPHTFDALLMEVRRLVAP